MAALAVFALLTATAIADSVPDGPGGPNIAIVNTSSLATSTLQADLPYLQTYVDQVCAAWHCSGHLYMPAVPAATDWVVTFNDISDIPGAIGYHTESNGLVEGYVSVKTAVQSGFRWGVVATHELAEMLVDPEAASAENTNNDCDPFTGRCSNATFYMKEICDPVQGESYKLGPLHVSDFVYRTWMEPDSPGPYDAGRHLKAPLSLAPSSYMSFYKNGVWSQTNSFPSARTDWDRFGPDLRRHS